VNPERTIRGLTEPDLLLILTRSPSMAWDPPCARVLFRENGAFVGVAAAPLPAFPTAHRRLS